MRAEYETLELKQKAKIEKNHRKIANTCETGKAKSKENVGNVNLNSDVHAQSHAT